jgi:hypothetical protein
MVDGDGVRAEDREITGCGCTVISVADGSEATFIDCLVRGAGQFGVDAHGDGARAILQDWEVTASGARGPEG